VYVEISQVNVHAGVGVKLALCTQESKTCGYGTTTACDDLAFDVGRGALKHGARADRAERGVGGLVGTCSNHPSSICTHTRDAVSIVWFV